MAMNGPVRVLALQLQMFGVGRFVRQRCADERSSNERRFWWPVEIGCCSGAARARLPKPGDAEGLERGELQHRKVEHREGRWSAAGAVAAIGRAVVVLWPGAGVVGLVAVVRHLRRRVVTVLICFVVVIHAHAVGGARPLNQREQQSTTETRWRDQERQRHEKPPEKSVARLCSPRRSHEHDDRSTDAAQRVLPQRS